MNPQEHPITPPPELVRQWWDGTHGAFYEFEAVVTQAARWGADQELEACRNWLRHEDVGGCGLTADWLYEARRPKPPSLKEQALEALAHILNNSSTQLGVDTIRRALETLPD